MGQPNGIQNKFSNSKIWQEVYYVIYLFQFLKTFPDSTYLYKTMETLSFKMCEICEISMKKYVKYVQSQQ